MTHISPALRPFSRLLLILVCGLSLVQNLQSEVPDPSLFSVEDFSGGLSIIGFTNRDKLGDVTIPDQLQGKAVTAIGDGAFANQPELTSVVLPNSLKKIGSEIFAQCPLLTTLTLPASSVPDISVKALNGCPSLTTVILPVQLKNLYNWTWVLGACQNLSAFETSPDSPWFSTEGGVLFNKQKSILIRYPHGRKDTGYQVPETVVVLGHDSFFSSVNLTSVTLPETLVEIQDSCFNNCTKLADIRLPESLISIGKFGFGNCYGLKELHVPHSLKTIHAQALTQTGIQVLDLPASVTLFAQQHENSLPFPFQLKELILHVKPYQTPDNGFGGPLSLDNATFKLCVPRHYLSDWQRRYPHVTIVPFDEVTWSGDFEYQALPAGLRIIGFKGKSDHVIIPETHHGETIVEIGSNAFRDGSFTSLAMPDSITSIGDWAFENCKYLTELSFSQHLTYLGRGAFARCSSLQVVRLPDSLKVFDMLSFERCSSLTSVRLPAAMESFHPEAFAECRQLEQITLSGGNGDFDVMDGVLFGKRGDALLYYPPHLPADSYDVPRCQSIGDYAFAHAENLRWISLPRSLVHIGKKAFYGCRKLGRLDLPEQVRTLGTDAFDDCSSLSGIICWGMPLPNLPSLLPASLRVVGVMPQYYEEWQEILPEPLLQPFDTMKAADLQLHITGPSVIQPHNNVLYEATVHYRGKKLQAPVISWELVTPKKGCALSANGVLTTDGTFEGGALTIKAVFDPRYAEACEATKDINVASSSAGVASPMKLSAGWNMVAPTVPLDASSEKKLRSMHPFGYSPKAGAYQLLDSFEPGKAFWLFAPEDMTLEQKGTTTAR